MKYGYARVSTIEQSLNLQIDALTQAGCNRVFSDHGVSGNIADRSGLNQLLHVLQNGDLLAVWKLDRLGRSLGMLCQLMERLSARWQSLSERLSVKEQKRVGERQKIGVYISVGQGY